MQIGNALPISPLFRRLADWTRRLPKEMRTNRHERRIIPWRWGSGIPSAYKRRMRPLGKGSRVSPSLGVC